MQRDEIERHFANAQEIENAKTAERNRLIAEINATGFNLHNLYHRTDVDMWTAVFGPSSDFAHGITQIEALQQCLTKIKRTITGQ